MTGRRRTSRAPDARSLYSPEFIEWAVGWVLLAGLLLSPAGCYPDEDAQLVRRYYTSGRVKVSVAGLERERRLDDATCTERATATGPVLEVVAPGREQFVDRAGVLLRPKPFIARIPAGLTSSSTEFRTSPETSYRAIASLFGVDLRARSYRMVQFLADPAARRNTTSGGEVDRNFDARCRVWRDDPHIKVVCSGARPFPWTAPGPIPEADFRARFVCE